MIRCIQKTDSKTTCELSEERTSRVRQKTLKARLELSEEHIPSSDKSVVETRVGVSKKYFALLPEYSNLFGKAWQIGTKAKNQNVARQTRLILLSIQEIINSFGQLGFDLGSITPIKAYECEDESVLMEWIYTNFRVGFAIEPDQAESGWYLVSNQALGEKSAYGNLLDSNMDKNLLWLLNFIIEHK